ncbi:MAG: hypothetical protein OXF58_01015 [Gammaproteobacteria bacterium]|nr:hypothetical protein [Gammaproteobacteria bacterium]
MAKTLQFTVVMVVLALVAGCNSTPVTRSSGAPGAPGLPPSSTGPSAPSGPSVRVEAPGMPGLPSGSAPGSGDTPGAPAPGRISVPTPQPGATSAGGNGLPSSTQGSTQQQSAGTTSAGASGPVKSEDEILAEALQALERRPAAARQGEASAQGEAGAGPGSAAGSPTMTGAEKKQVLGEELEQGFAEFDRVMLSEQQANSERADREGGGGYAEDDAFAAADATMDGSAGEPLQTALVDSDPISVKGEGNTPTPSHSQVPPDLADAKDDDIIARQLREAAMKEQDPELKEKLWDEYRKYKRDLR